jgi:hypothetical protein
MTIEQQAFARIEQDITHLQRFLDGDRDSIGDVLFGLEVASDLQRAMVNIANVVYQRRYMDSEVPILECALADADTRDAA